MIEYQTIQENEVFFILYVYVYIYIYNTNGNIIYNFVGKYIFFVYI